MISDLHYILRQIVKAPGFAATVLATFTLCIGTNALIFAVVHAVLLRPLPFPDPERLVSLWSYYPASGVEHAANSAYEHVERNEGVPAFTEVGSYRTSNAVVGEAGSSQLVPVFQVTPSFFRVLSVPAAMGRLLLDEEGEVGRDHVVVLSHAFWRQNFNSDPSVVGQTMRVDGVSKTIVGVLPEDFNFLAMNASVWEPLAFTDSDLTIAWRHNNELSMIGRLKPGFSLAEAQLQVDDLNERAAKTDPLARWAKEQNFHTKVFGLHADYVAKIRPTLVLLQAGAFFLLLIGIVNLVNLFLIRSSVRSKELALRQVLGASRTRLFQTLCLETILFSTVGAGLGLLGCRIGIGLLVTLGAQRLPLGTNITLNAQVVLGAIIGSLAMGLLLALVTTGWGRQRDLGQGLNAESRSGTASRASHRLRHSLIVAQIALAFVLLFGAGLLGLSFRNVLAAGPGFEADNVVAGRIVLPTANYNENSARLDFAERLLEGMRLLPGVRAAGIGTELIPSQSTRMEGVRLDGMVKKAGVLDHNPYIYSVMGDYFQAMGVPLREGRFLDSRDSHRTDDVCVVDEAFARHAWPGKSGVGRYTWLIGPRALGGGRFYTVVGVVGTVKRDVADRDQEAFYIPFSANYAPAQFMTLTRTTSPALSAAPGMREALSHVDRGLPLADIRTMEDRVKENLTLRRAAMLLAAIFAAMAVVLATIGIYGVMAYVVTQREREIGVRMALGAEPSRILQQFLTIGGRLLAVGAIFGLIGAWFLGRAMKTLLFRVIGFDPVILIGTAIALAVVVLAASLFPSLRAARMSPLDALRKE